MADNMRYVQGFVILGSMLTPGGHGTMPGRVILVDRNFAGYDTYKDHRYVVAWQAWLESEPASESCWCGSWTGGDYHFDKAEAIRAFGERCVRLG